MTALVQRVKYVKMDIYDPKTGTKSHVESGRGLLIFVGVGVGDDMKKALRLAERCRGMRIFEDENGKMNLSVNDIGGSAVIVSNFTLYADTSHGKRPSFINAARPEQAVPLYEAFIEEFRKHTPVQTGVFGADMQIESVNDGPINIVVTED